MSDAISRWKHWTIYFAQCAMKWYERPIVGVAIMLVLIVLLALAVVWSGIDKLGVQ